MDRTTGNSPPTTSKGTNTGIPVPPTATNMAKFTNAHLTPKEQAKLKAQEVPPAEKEAKGKVELLENLNSTHEIEVEALAKKKKGLEKDAEEKKTQVQEENLQYSKKVDEDSKKKKKEFDDRARIKILEIEEKKETKMAKLDAEINTRLRCIEENRKKAKELMETHKKPK